MEPRCPDRSRRARALCWTLFWVAMVVMTSSLSYALYRDGDLWPPSVDGVTRIPVCFIFSGGLLAEEDARQRALVEETLAATWGRWLEIEFAGFDTCPAPPPNAVLAIELRGGEGYAGDIPDQTKHLSGHRGFQGSATPTWGWMMLSGPSDHLARAVITHEVGHALSFEHEQSRPDAAGFCPRGDSLLDGTILTIEYDDIGIMNYCTPGAHLSRLDIEGAQTLYGTSAAGQWLNALPAISQLPLL